MVVSSPWPPPGPWSCDGVWQLPGIRAGGCDGVRARGVRVRPLHCRLPPPSSGPPSAPPAAPLPPLPVVPPATAEVPPPPIGRAAAGRHSSSPGGSPTAPGDTVGLAPRQYATIAALSWALNRPPDRPYDGSLFLQFLVECHVLLQKEHLGTPRRGQSLALWPRKPQREHRCGLAMNFPVKTPSIMLLSQRATTHAEHSKIPLSASLIHCNRHQCSVLPLCNSVISY